jgi:hypothetical protein
MASLTIRPGSRIRLKGQDSHVPDFIVVRCDRDQCWIRQQNWHSTIQLNVRFSQILIPSEQSFVASVATMVEAPSIGGLGHDYQDNVIYLEDYRKQKAIRALSESLPDN